MIITIFISIIAAPSEASGSEVLLLGVITMATQLFYFSLLPWRGKVTNGLCVAYLVSIVFVRVKKFLAYSFLESIFKALENKSLASKNCRCWNFNFPV